MELKLYFADFFEVNENVLDEYGAFNISLINDLPFFIDPFLLFKSKKPQYQQLHNEIIEYLRFLKEKSVEDSVTEGLLNSWYNFPEVKQNWLGLCKKGNSGKGLGPKFANALHRNLVKVFANFGEENITKSTHLEKLCLIDKGVGKDKISDFTTNLIKRFLLKFTEEFSIKYIDGSYLEEKSVEKVIFDYNLETWVSENFTLPVYNGDHVILTPVDILTKDEIWINNRDFIRNFNKIPKAIDNKILRDEISNYFRKMLPKKKKHSMDDISLAAYSTIEQFPEILDYYIHQKEIKGNEAISLSKKQIIDSKQLYVSNFGSFVNQLDQLGFYNRDNATKLEVKEKIDFLKNVIEKKGGYKIFWQKGQPVRRESDIHILYRLVWHNTKSDVSREVNDGQGPADFKISRGSQDVTLVEFKLASNSGLKRNLQRQLEKYKEASDAEYGYKVIFYFTIEELGKVNKIRKELDMINDPYIVLVDARKDNKPSGSKA